MKALGILLAALFALTLAGCAGAGTSSGFVPVQAISVPVGQACTPGLSVCAGGAYCRPPAGQCANAKAGSGKCVVAPAMCTMDYNPVCGCDGKTYGNSCAASGAGVGVLSKGECRAGAEPVVAKPEAVPVVTPAPAPSQKRSWFRWPFSGKAKTPAPVTVAEPEPVAAPVSAPEPVALGEGTACVLGGQGAGACAEGLYCSVLPGTCLNPVAEGTCKRIPQICTKEFRPVEGCDGQTYGNTCMAAAAGVNVARGVRG